MLEAPELQLTPCQRSFVARLFECQFNVPVGIIARSLSRFNGLQCGFDPQWLQPLQ